MFEVLNAFYSESENRELLKFRALVAVTLANLAASGGAAVLGVFKLRSQKSVAKKDGSESFFSPFCFLLIYATSSKITEPDQTASLPAETSKLPICVKFSEFSQVQLRDC